MEARKFFNIVREKAFGSAKDKCEGLHENTILDVKRTMYGVAIHAITNDVDWWEIALAAADAVRSGIDTISIRAEDFSYLVSQQYIRKSVEAFSIKNGYHQCPNYDEEAIIDAATKAVRDGVIEALTNLGFENFEVGEKEPIITLVLPEFS